MYIAYLISILRSKKWFRADSDIRQSLRPLSWATVIMLAGFGCAHQPTKREAKNYCEIKYGKDAHLTFNIKANMEKTKGEFFHCYVKILISPKQMRELKRRRQLDADPKLDLPGNSRIDESCPKHLPVGLYVGHGVGYCGE